ncbi:MAG: glutamine amidotransferase [Gammaproteobacteria bacterium]|nr:glutamine amidotransferase [Gammaproteobacteria bacterium]MDX2478647.1 glutamine amidotransferase [Gammaproteobacteria bacterium]MDX2488792.1 glutamine amidotransferase [Gammaproteobacteria bacterium]
MTKPFLIMQLRPEDDTSDNEYAAILKYGGLDSKDTRRLRIEKNGIPDDLILDQYSGIIVGGSPFDISTPEQDKSAIQKKIERDFNRLFDLIVPNDIPFLGACSGNGLLGSYLGTSISTRYGEAVGCAQLDITEAGKADPLLSGFPGQINVLLGHKEACDTVPDGATLLMTGNVCQVQMFRVRNNVYATQFHPEGDSDGFTVRIHAYKHHGYFEPDEADNLINAVCEEDTPYAQEILRRFVNHYKR